MQHFPHVVRLLLLVGCCRHLPAAQQQLIPPYTCTTTVCQPGHVGAAEVAPKGAQGAPGKRGAAGPKGDKGDPCQCNMADEEAMEGMRANWLRLTEENRDMKTRIETLESVLNFLPENCTEYSAATESDEVNHNVVPIYPLKFIGDLTPLMTDCKKVLRDERDGWIAIQRRLDGGTDFYRNWESYARGFGDRNGEFWIGLRNLHKMTSTRTCKLHVSFKDWDKSTRHADYSTFRVGNEASFFRLTVSGYSGNIQDSMAHHNNRRFSSFDLDNDDNSSNCAKRYKGPWWHGTCHDSNLNGQYFKTATADNTGIWWGGFSHSLPYVEMSLLCI